ncbi:MAG: alginate export family protein [Geobacter sp.]|nr:alginate export family protein [Geobacter sp.]
MKRIRIIYLILSAVILCAAPCFAVEEERDIPAEVTYEHWSCKEIMVLSDKYGAAVSFRAGSPVLRKQLAEGLLEVLTKVQEKCEVDGVASVPREDLDRLAVLYGLLKDEMAQYEGYLQRREAIEKILAKPEEPPFLVRYGVSGFLRGEGAANQLRTNDLSHAPGHTEGRFVYRIKPYVYWHPTDFIDLHFEGQSYGYTGPQPDYDNSGLYQGFIHVGIPDQDWLKIKGGRQELEYGSTFVLGADTFFDGQSYDGVKVTLQPSAKLGLDLLWGTHVAAFNGRTEGTMSGAYLTMTCSEGNALELYALRDSGSLDHQLGEKRYYWGGRATAKLGPVSLEAEPVWQTGKLFNSNTSANDEISAYGGHVDLTVEAPINGLNSNILVSYGYGSGDQASADGTDTSNEFTNPNNDSSLPGDMSVIFDFSGLTLTAPDGTEYHASGLDVYTLGWGIDLTKELNFSATGRYFMAKHVPANFSRRLGLEADFTATWNFSEDISLILGYDRFFTGKFFRDATGDASDIQYGYAMLQFHVFGTKQRSGRKS